MISSELDAAGVMDPSLRDAYRQCREINARDGKTFFLATRLLAPAQRPAVHALYGFARRADDILDEFDETRGDEVRARQLQQFSTQLFNSLVENQVSADDPTLVPELRKGDMACFLTMTDPTRLRGGMVVDGEFGGEWAIRRFVGRRGGRLLFGCVNPHVGTRYEYAQEEVTLLGRLTVQYRYW